MTLDPILEITLKVSGSEAVYKDRHNGQGRSHDDDVSSSD
jgi:hypothetical protein